MINFLKYLFLSIKALNKSTEVRGKAFKALGEMNDDRSTTFLFNTISEENDPALLEIIEQGLIHKGKKAIPFISNNMPCSNCKLMVQYSISKLTEVIEEDQDATKSSVHVILKFCKQISKTRIFGIRILGKIGGETECNLILETATENYWDQILSILTSSNEISNNRIDKIPEAISQIRKIKAEITTASIDALNLIGNTIAIKKLNDHIKKSE